MQRITCKALCRGLGREIESVRARQLCSCRPASSDRQRKCSTQEGFWESLLRGRATHLELREFSPLFKGKRRRNDISYNSYLSLQKTQDIVFYLIDRRSFAIGLPCLREPRRLSGFALILLAFREATDSLLRSLFGFGPRLFGGSCFGRELF